MVFLLNIVANFREKAHQLTNEEEKYLLEKALQGDTAAFEQVFRLYVKQLCAFVAYYVKSFDAAEDIVQNLFLLLWERRATIQIEGSLKTYFFTSARNLAINYLKHETIERTSSEVFSSLSVTPQATPQEIVEHQELDVLLSQEIEKLPERCRIIFILSRFFSFKYSEIAEILGISVKTVDAQMVHAVKKLRSKLPNQ